MWLAKFFFIKSGFFFSASAGRRECFIGVQHINPSGRKRAVDLLSEGQPGWSQLLESFGASAGDDFPDFERQPFVDFFQRGSTAHQQIPDGHRQFAREGTRRQIDSAYQCFQ
jgi:hypothetical protein